MKTKLFSLIIILMLSASWAFAQNANENRLSFAVLGGVNFQNLNGKNANGDKLTNDMIIGYHLGVNVQIPFAPEFFFQPGLLFSTKGAKNTSGALTTTYKLSYIELPLNLVYKGLLGNGHILLGFGPYLGYGIGGKVIVEGGSASLKSNIEFKNVVTLEDSYLTTYFRSFDAGGNIFAGYELAGGLFFQINAQWGMIKINPEDQRLSNDRSSVKNTGFGLSLGYRF